MEFVFRSVQKDFYCKHLLMILPGHLEFAEFDYLWTIFFFYLDALECLTCDADILFRVP